MLQWLKDFLPDYAAWTLLDWLREGSGWTAILTATGRVLAWARGWSPKSKHTLTVILATSAGLSVLAYLGTTFLSSALRETPRTLSASGGKAAPNRHLDAS